MNELAHYFTFLLLCFDTASLIYNRMIWIYKLLLRSIKINKIILPSLVHWMISVETCRPTAAYEYKINERTCSDFFQESKLQIIWLGQHYFGHDSEKCVHTRDTSCPIMTGSPKIWVTESTLRIMSETGLVTIEMRSHLLFILTESCLCCPSHLFLLRCERSLSFNRVSSEVRIDSTANLKSYNQYKAFKILNQTQQIILFDHDITIQYNLWYVIVIRHHCYHF